MAANIVDATLEHHGSIFLFRTYTPEIRRWFRENTDAQSLGNAFAVEARYFMGIVEGLQADGFLVE